MSIGTSFPLHYFIIPAVLIIISVVLLIAVVKSKKNGGKNGGRVCMLIIIALLLIPESYFIVNGIDAIEYKWLYDYNGSFVSSHDEVKDSEIYLEKAPGVSMFVYCEDGISKESILNLFEEIKRDLFPEGKDGASELTIMDRLEDRFEDFDLHFYDGRGKELAEMSAYKYVSHVDRTQIDGFKTWYNSYEDEDYYDDDEDE